MQTDLELALEAARLSGAARERLLADRLGDDPDHRARVEHLIALTEQRTLGAAAQDAAEAGPTAPIQQLPGYRIVRLLGRGAMGSVYLAEQRTPAREVALKLIPIRADDEAANARFARETELLARMQHHGIARLYDSGRSADHRWLAMEYIAGTPLTEACREMPLKRRVETLLAVCEAVQHAHARGVIHRDLKPANILVDAQGAPKVLDFGIAASLDQEHTLLTHSGEIIGTLAYMSPEQLAADHARIDVKSDVYALGALLYELIAGTTPHALAGRTTIEAIATVAQKAAVPLRRVAPDCPEDLALIAHCALAEDPERRYATAEAMAADLRRWLQLKPILARTPSLGYSLGKWIRRQRLAAAALGVALLSLVAAIIVGSIYSAAEHRARALAEERLVTVEAMYDFLRRTLTSADPAVARGEQITMREVLDGAVETVGRQQDQHPRATAEIRQLLGRTLVNLGAVDSGREQLAASLALFQSLPDTDPRTILQLEVELAAVQRQQGDAPAAVADLQPLLARIEADYGPNDLLWFDAAVSLIVSHTESSEADAAIALGEDAATRAMAVLGAEHELTVQLRHNLAEAYILKGRYAEHAGILRELLAIRTRTLGADHPGTLSLLHNLAGSLRRGGQLDEALALYQRLEAVQADVLDDDHPDRLATTNNRVSLLLELGRTDEAAPLHQGVIDGAIRRWGADNDRTLIARTVLARIHEDRGQDEQAMAIYRDVVAELDRRSGPLNPDVAVTRNNYAVLLTRRGEHDAAIAQLERLIAEVAPQVGEDHLYIALFRNNLGEALTHARQRERALAELRASHPTIEQTFGADHGRTEKSQQRIAAAEALPTED